MNIKLLVLLSCTMLLSSCGNSGKSDEYDFTEKQYQKSSVQVNIIEHKSADELHAAVAPYLKNSSVDPNIVRAFSLLKPPVYDTCTMHIVDPTVSYEPEFVGHEFLHCVYGQWHKNNKSH